MSGCSGLYCPQGKHHPPCQRRGKKIPLLIFILLHIGNQAFSHLTQIMSFGERVPGTEGHKRAIEYISSNLKNSGYKVEFQKFEQSGVSFTNIIGSYKGKTKKILLATHYDTKLGILGANDGGSGVALLLALLDTLKTLDISISVVFFDGEDYGENAPLIGSIYFAKNLKNQKEWKMGIVIDMIGDKELEIFQEINSLRYAPRWTEKIFDSAREVSALHFYPVPKYAIKDDHIPLNQKGIPTVLLIDFDYPYWHTPMDTIDKCSSESMLEVGEVLINFLNKFK